MKPKTYYENEEWRYTAHAIVKYQPCWYCEPFGYTKDEWTQRADVGRVFDHQLFTMEEYQETEQRYVDAVRKIAELAECKYLTVAYMGQPLYWAKQSVKEMLVGRFAEYDRELCDFFIKLHEGKRLNMNEAIQLVRLNLRGLAVTDLVNESRQVEFHFGDDFYMYCNTRLPKDVLKTEVEKLGLYLNPMNHVLKWKENEDGSLTTELIEPGINTNE